MSAIRCGGMMATATRRPDKPRYALSAVRVAALALLLVLATGLSVTNLTSGWIGFLPYHDHLILGARAIGLVHHAHHGDPLDHAQRYLRSVETSASGAAIGQPHADGVVSLRPMTAQPELNTTTAVGWGAGFALPAPPDAGLLALLAALLLAGGLRYAPPIPPPRFA